MNTESASPGANSDSSPFLAAEVIESAVVASIIAVAIALLARFILNISTPAEIFGDRLTRFIPVPVFSRLLDLFGGNAKHFYFGGLLVFEVLATALAGVLYFYLRERLLPRYPEIERFLSPDDEPNLREVPLIAVLFWVVSAGVLAPILGGGFLGADLIGGWTNVLVSQVIPNIAFAISFIVLLRRALERSVGEMPAASRAALSRRRLIQEIGFGALVIAGGALAWDFITGGASSLLGGGTNKPPLKLGNVPKHVEVSPTPTYGPWTTVPGLTPEVTSPQDFYYVSKNLAGDPQINEATWQLQIHGMVQNPYTLSFAELQSLPQIQQYHTLECISNVIGGDLISNSLFVGASLADIIQHAGIKTGASDLVFTATDGYSDSLHLSQVLDPRSLIVYQIDGQPLPQSHGYPARLLIPGLYGMKNCKWVTSLQVSSGSYTGYWEQQGWTDEAIVKTMSRIDVPQEDDLLLAKPTYIAGIAFAGDRGIAEVDVSTDSGQTWHSATLRKPLGNLTWVFWEYLWSPTSSGTYILVVRAIDGQGNVQTPLQEDPIPDGATGYDAIGVTVR